MPKFDISWTVSVHQCNLRWVIVMHHLIDLSHKDLCLTFHRFAPLFYDNNHCLEFPECVDSVVKERIASLDCSDIKDLWRVTYKVVSGQFHSLTCDSVVGGAAKKALVICTLKENNFTRNIVTLRISPIYELSNLPSCLCALSATTIAAVKSGPIQPCNIIIMADSPSLTWRIALNNSSNDDEVSEYIAWFSRRGRGGGALAKCECPYKMAQIYTV